MKINLYQHMGTEDKATSTVYERTIYSSFMRHTGGLDCGMLQIWINFCWPIELFFLEENAYKNNNDNISFEFYGNNVSVTLDDFYQAYKHGLSISTDSFYTLDEENALSYPTQVAISFTCENAKIS